MLAENVLKIIKANNLFPTCVLNEIVELITLK